MSQVHPRSSRALLLLCRALVAGALLVPLTALAQEKPADKPQEKIISGQVRVRTELDDRGLYSPDQAVFVHLLRSRLRATVRPVAGITVLAEVQDARYWGQSDPSLARGTTDADADQLDMHQAWAQIDSVLGVPLSLRVGRQEMSFANERLVGTSQWSNTSRSFDAARATLGLDGFTADLFASRLSAPAAGRIESQNLYGLWASWKPSTLLAVDLFGLRDDNTSLLRRGEDSGLASLERYSAGAYLRLVADPVDAELEGIIQTGSTAATDSTARRAINAFMASATVGVTILQESKTRIYALATALSGDGSPDDDRAESFNTLFGTNHRYHGNMDIVPESIGLDAGLVDLSAGVTSQPVKGLRLLFEAHLLKPQRGSSESFGTELDLVAFWRANTSFELSGGGGIFAPGEALPWSDKSTRTWLYVAGQFDF